MFAENEPQKYNSPICLKRQADRASTADHSAVEGVDVVDVAVVSDSVETSEVDVLSAVVDVTAVVVSAAAVSESIPPDRSVRSLPVIAYTDLSPSFMI